MPNRTDTEANGRDRGESVLHQQAKKEIPDALSQDLAFPNVVIERRLDGVRPDISGLILLSELFFTTGLPRRCKVGGRDDA